MIYRSSVDANIEKGLVDTVGEGQGGTSWESSKETYTLLLLLLFSHWTPCDPINCSMPGFSVIHYLLESPQTRPLSHWCHNTIPPSSVVPFFSCLHSSPAIGSSPMSPLFASGGQSIGASASASVLPMNIQNVYITICKKIASWHILYDARSSNQVLCDKVEGWEGVRGGMEVQEKGDISIPNGFPGSSVGKDSPSNAGDPGLIPGSGRSPGEGIGYPLQYSCLENPHGQRSLVRYSPWGLKESDMTERLSTTLLIHVDVRQRLTQYCKAIILQ